MTATATANARTKAEREGMLMQVQRAIGAEVRRSGIVERHHEDVEQELQLAVWEASAKFDPSRGTKWSTYAIGVIKNVVANWRTRNHHLDDGSIRQKDEVFFDRLPWPQEYAPAGPHDDSDELDGETMGELSTALRQGLAEGVLSQLSPGYRRLVEAVAFEGLTADQIATQHDFPVKAVRVNLKAAIKRLCALGATQHAVTDAEVAAVTGPQEQLSAEQKERQSLANWNRGREDTRLRNELAQELAHDGAADALDAFGAEVKAVALEVAAKKLSITQAGTRLKVMGPRTRELFRRLIGAVRMHVSGLVASELTQAATGSTFRGVLNEFGPDAHAGVLAILDGSLTVDDVAELLGGDRAAVLNRLRNVATVSRNGATAAVADRGELIAR